MNEPSSSGQSRFGKSFVSPPGLNGNSVHTIPKCAKLSLTGAFSVVFCIKIEYGEDTYIPDKLPLKAYDLEAEMCYKGDLGTAYDKIMAFQNYLTGENGDGATLKIYNSHTGIGRQGLYLLEVGDFEFNKSNMDEVLTFPVKFRVTDPRTQIIPSYSVAEPTKIVALVEKV